MIRRLRVRHRVCTSVLAVVLPVGVAAALMLRPKPLLALEIPFTSADPATIGPIVERDDLFGDAHVRARLWTEPATTATGNASVAADARVVAADARVVAADARVVELTPERDFERPDLLVYWCPSAPSGDAPPAGSILIGSLSGTQSRRMRLPQNARNERGWLCIYCLAEPEIVAVATLEPGI